MTYFCQQNVYFLNDFCSAADGIKIINQLNDDVFTTVINYVHKNMPLSGEAADTADDDGGLEK